VTKVRVDETDRGPEPDAPLDHDAFVSLAIGVLAQAFDDLDVRKWRQ
jgi:hypothetical protein